MRKTILLCLATIAMSCNSSAEKDTVKKDSAEATHPDYAYTIKNPDNWQTGSTKNTAVVLASLKAFENNKLDECIGYFADTVSWKSDYMESKLSRQGLKDLFISSWKDVASMKINMEDFESVISKDKKDEYVTLWYVQTTTDKKGKTDSIFISNDLKMVNGKITELNETIRHFPVKK
ncbi:MAG: hypothetical protein V4557_04185 [Bacteroidota bacterium]